MPNNRRQEGPSTKLGRQGKVDAREAQSQSRALARVPGTACPPIKQGCYGVSSAAASSPFSPLADLGLPGAPLRFDLGTRTRPSASSSASATAGEKPSPDSVGANPSPPAAAARAS